jgi:hypothetical protein
MIKIQKSKTADTRTCDFANVKKETLFNSSIQHIGDVKNGLEYFKGLLDTAALNHDSDKLTDIEGFGAHQLRILQNEFVSDDQFVEHLRIFNSSSTGTSLIKANDFNSTTTGFELSDEVIGILSQGNNSNLNIICNTFSNMGVDIFNVSGATLSDLPLNQNTLKNASNTFSSISGFPDRFNILNILFQIF